MANQRKLLEDAINQIMKEKGFRKKGSLWYFESNETISILELQKSNWGEQFYINLGVYIKQLGDTSIPPKEHHCHIRGRHSSIVESKEEIEKFLDFESKLNTEEEKLHMISISITKYALPLLLMFSSIESIKILLDNQKLNNFLVSVKVKELLKKE